MMAHMKAPYSNILLHASVSYFSFSDSRNMALCLKVAKVILKFKNFVNLEVLQNTLKLYDIVFKRYGYHNNHNINLCDKFRDEIRKFGEWLKLYDSI